jgi:molecular chaperone GrpE
MKQVIQDPSSVGPEASASATKITATESNPLHQELHEQKDLNLRLAADFENFKRRSRQEVESRAAAQKESFIQELLPSIDNLERALASGASPGSLQFQQGVEMTLQQLRLLLRQHGIETEEIIGQPFDPHRHEAVSQRHDPTQADHAVLEVFQRGYRRGDTVFRPAKVVINDPKHARQGRHAR